MKAINKYLAIALAAFSMTGCRDYLTEIEPGTTLLDDFFVSTDAAVQNVTACYTPLMWEFQGTYLPEWFIGDVVSDDALKGGGSTSDMGDVYACLPCPGLQTNIVIVFSFSSIQVSIVPCF